MAYILWIFSIVCPFLVNSESGDYDESIRCSSTLTLKQCSLTCLDMDAGDFDEIEFLTLCSSKDCVNGTLRSNSFSFQNLSLLTAYKLYAHYKVGEVFTKNINLVKIVKITTPEIANATYRFEEAVIYFNYNHDYVKKPYFQVKITSKSVYKVLQTTYQPMTIGKDLLKDNEVYSVSVRAKPRDYFGGSWTNWSQEKSFIVNTVEDQVEQPPLIIYALLCTSVILLIFIGLVALRCKEIKALISPNIPYPKATLAQIHRLNEHPPVSFSPEMFSDININRVDYTEETQLTSELSERDATITGCHDSGAGDVKCSLTEMQDEGGQSLEVETSHMKIKLLDRSVSAEKGEDNVGIQSLAALQRGYKDETYVTMSSLHKTQ